MQHYRPCAAEGRNIEMMLCLPQDEVPFPLYFAAECKTVQNVPHEACRQVLTALALRARP